MDEVAPEQGSTRVRTGEIGLREAARIQQSDRERVTQRKRRGGACRRREVQWAGFLRNARVQMNVGLARKRRIGLAGHCNQFGALALQQRHDRQQLCRVPGVRDADEDILGAHHAEIAVACLGGVHEERRGTGARQRRGDLAADMTRLADPAHHYATAAGEYQVHRREELPVDAIHERADGVSLDHQHFAGERDGICAGTWGRCGRNAYHSPAV